MVCDGDRSGPGTRIKDRVRRISAEVNAIPGSTIWITAPREIENYLPGAVIASALGLDSLPDPGQYEPFFPRKGMPPKSSYLEKRIKRRGLDKMDLAVQAVPFMKKEMMEMRFDLADKIESIITAIRKWNA